jgi:hypothetical protein
MLSKHQLYLLAEMLRYLIIFYQHRPEAKLGHLALRPLTILRRKKPGLNVQILKDGQLRPASRTPNVMKTLKYIINDGKKLSAGKRMRGTRHADMF